MMRPSDDLIKDAEAILAEGNWDAASKILAKAIKQIGNEPTGDKAKRALASALRLRSFADSRRGEHKSAVQDAKKALNISLSIGDIEGEADALRRLGYIHWQKADYPMAIEFYNSALEKANACGAKKLLGRTKVELANAYNYMGDTKMAIRVYKDAINILEEEKDYHDLGRALNNLGSAQMHAENLNEAELYLKRCITVCESTGNIATKGWALFNLGECFVQLGRPKDALPRLDEASKILAKTDDNVGLAITYMVYGMAYSGLMDWPKAQSSFDNAFRLERKLQMPGVEGDLRREYGKMLTAKGENDKAIKELTKALEIFKAHAQKKEATDIAELLKALKK